MSDMIERVARVLATESGHNFDLFMPHARDTYREMARNIIAAMREPTTKMKYSGANELRLKAMTVDHETPLPSDAARCFIAMIDAALSEPQANAGKV